MLLSVVPVLFLYSAAGSEPTPPQRLAAALRDFRAAHGGSWEVHTDAETGFAEMLYGGNAPFGGAVRTEAEARAVSDAALEATRALHGVDTASLAFDRVAFLPLGQIGSGDKWAVRYGQRAGGLTVVQGSVNVLVDARGRLLSVQSTAVAGELAPPTAPSVPAGSALAVAGDAFLVAHGLRAADASEPVLVARRVVDAGRRTARAAWSLDLSYEAADAEPIAERYFVDASSGAVLAVEPLIHDFDVTGTVMTKATPGLAPDSAGNPETDHVLRYARVQSSAGERTTDANGVFTYAGIDVPLQVTVTYFGPHASVQNFAGAAYSLVQTVQPNTPTTVLMNPASIDAVTAQANAMVGINSMRDWLRSVDALDATMEMQFTASVNQPLTCNATYGGNIVNFYSPGNGCPNSSYSTVVGHEMGHWMNVLYSTDNGPDGMGEGNADVWTMYQYDTPIVAQDFFGPGQPIRTGLNTRPFCGDTNPGCYATTHDNGEPWMGAAWKVRNRLNQTHGNAIGDAIANQIFLGWMNGFDQRQIRSIIETQWLTLDDDDGFLANGTPHFADIDGGFRDQAFPGITLVPLTIEGVTLLPDTENSTQPYVVEATISANFAPPLVARTLRWRVHGGAFVDVPMTPVGGLVYRASIPAQPYPSLVQYYVQAQDSAARVATWPPSAPEQLQSFDVGTLNQVALYGFENSTQGWTTGAVGDAGNPEVDWARGTPQGRTGNAGGIAWRDPASAYAGFFCFANDLGISGADGAYSSNVHSYLRSPVVNCSGRQNVRLRFHSWLSVDALVNDQARVLVNGTQFYFSPTTARSDTGWGMQEFDISSVAADNPSVQVEFRLRSNGAEQLGGWAVDDVRIFSLSVIVPPCPAPTTFCVAAPNSVGGGAQIGFSGTGNLILNDLDLFVFACPSNTSGMFFYAPNAVQVPFGDGFRCAAGTTFRLGMQTTDSFGDATRSIDWNALASGPSIPGQVWKFQFWYRDPSAGGAGFNLSNGLSVTVCD